MKKEVLTFMSCVALLASFSSTKAGSNNGYTSAANVYSGSSSHSWFGGGVDYVLSEWRKEKEDKLKAPEAPVHTEVEVPVEQDSSTH